jgi:hypothetical protein
VAGQRGCGVDGNAVRTPDDASLTVFMTVWTGSYWTTWHRYLLDSLGTRPGFLGDVGPGTWLTSRVHQLAGAGTPSWLSDRCAPVLLAVMALALKPLVVTVAHRGRWRYESEIRVVTLPQRTGSSCP